MNNAKHIALFALILTGCGGSAFEVPVTSTSRPEIRQGVLIKVESTEGLKREGITVYPGMGYIFVPYGVDAPPLELANVQFAEDNRALVDHGEDITDQFFYVDLFFGYMVGGGRDLAPAGRGFREATPLLPQAW